MKPGYRFSTTPLYTDSPMHGIAMKLPPAEQNGSLPVEHQPAIALGRVHCKTMTSIVEPAFAYNGSGQWPRGGTPRLAASQMVFPSSRCAGHTANFAYPIY